MTLLTYDSGSVHMKNKVIVSCLLLCVVLFNASLASSQIKLKALYERKQFFELRDALKEIGSTGEGEDLSIAP